MRWTRSGKSPNLEDRRGAGGRAGGSALPLLFMLARSKIGLALIAVFFVVAWLAGVNPLSLLAGGAPADSGSAPVDDPGEAELVEFVSFVLDDTQEVWAVVLPREEDRAYGAATLVLFRDNVRSACGMGSASMGPFYCPADQKVYIDLGFYDALRRRFGAPGDFAQAYVIAHEIGHHVQNLLGIAQQVQRMQEQRPDDANALSVKMELQADCFAGVWGHSAAARELLVPGDLEEGLDAAAAIGDDRIQQKSGQQVNPEAFTHGTSEQRVGWFRRGFDSGDPSACDTFGG